MRGCSNCIPHGRTLLDHRDEVPSKPERQRRSAWSATSLFQRTVVKWIALKSPLRWLPGVKTRPEVDQEIGGTRPTEFGWDVEALSRIVERFTRQPRELAWRPHPTFGALRWGYLHIDHHLRQFSS
jgi:hypothetical protein